MNSVPHICVNHSDWSVETSGHSDWSVETSGHSDWSVEKAVIRTFI